MRALLVLALVGCAPEPVRDPRPDPTAPTRVWIATPGGTVAVAVELAHTPARIERGLMHRAQLPADAGMLFLMGRDHDWAFWMRDTLIPLDVVFIAKDRTVAGVVARMQPGSERPRRLGAPSRYVLEVNAGWAAQHGVSAGQPVRFENLEP